MIPPRADASSIQSQHPSSDNGRGNDDSCQRTSLREWLAVVSIAGGTFALVTAQFLPIGLKSDIARDLQITEQLILTHHLWTAFVT